VEEETEENNYEAQSGDASQEVIELYRRENMFEITLEDWRAALNILQEEGWQPVHPLGKYVQPPWLITHDEGKEMQLTARSLFAKIDTHPGLSASVPMDLGVFYRLADFIGEGAFIVGWQSSFAHARANDFSESELT